MSRAQIKNGPSALKTQNCREDVMDYRLIQAYCRYEGKWPYRDLPSGVMFWFGLRITVADFIKLSNSQGRGSLVHSGNEHLLRD